MYLTQQWMQYNNSSINGPTYTSSVSMSLMFACASESHSRSHAVSSPLLMCEQRLANMRIACGLHRSSISEVFGNYCQAMSYSLWESNIPWGAIFPNAITQCKKRPWPPTHVMNCLWFNDPACQKPLFPSTIIPHVILILFKWIILWFPWPLT